MGKRVKRVKPKSQEPRALEVCPPGSKHEERRGRADGRTGRTGGRKACGPTLGRLARPSERNGRMVFGGSGEDDKKEERLSSRRRTKTHEIRRASVGGQPRV